MNNAGFELGLSDWNTFSGTATLTSDAFSGNTALALSSSRSGVGQGFSAVAGGVYTLSGYGKTTDDGWSGFGLRFVDQEGSLLEKSATRITTSEWSDYQIESIAPAGAARGFLSVWKSDDGGTTVVDELTVSRSLLPPSPSDELLSNPDFETGLTDWNGFNGSETTTTDAFEGSQGLQLSTPGSGASQTVAVVPGQRYQLSGYTKTNNTNWNGWGRSL